MNSEKKVFGIRSEYRINYIGFLFVLLFYSILFLVFKDDPFFGDAISTISRASHHIIQSGFTSIAYPEHLDPGHPIIFPILYAGIWQIFGLQLPVSHVVNLIFSLGIVFLIWRWTKRDQGRIQAWAGVFLLLCTPIFIAQTAQMNTHLPLTFFVLGFAYSLRFNRLVWQIVFSSLILITHLQGMYYLVPLLMWWFFKEERPFKEKVIYLSKMLLVPVTLFIIWLFYHHSITGWWISSPTYSGHRGMPSIKRIFINLILADWRISDYGQIALFIVPLIVFFKRDFKLTWNHPMAIFLMLYVFNSITLAITTQTGPAHRYLLGCLPFMIMMNVYMMKQVNRRVWFVVIPILLSGHFWFYPGKVMGDATLAYRDLFPLIEQMNDEFPNELMYSYAPLSNPGVYTYLNGESADRRALYDVDVNSVKYVIRSNISGDFPIEQVAMLQNDWSVRTYQKGYVYVEVYANPVQTEIPNPNKRIIHGFEKWMIDMKQKIKGENAH
jgi:hypothetical protein